MPQEAPRNACALQGAVRTATAISGVVPVVHATAGCGLQNYLSGCLANGGQGAGQVGGLALPSTNILEKHVIFGGSSRLREQLKNTVRIVKGDLYLVISGCTPELVGDDSDAMTGELIDQGYPAAYFQASGFTGHAYHGYQLTVKKIIEFIAASDKPVGKTDGLVNILGIVPGQDSLWLGDLERLGKSLSAAGIKANRLFGPGQSLKSWRRLARARLNLVVSPWGIEIAEDLENRYGTPFVWMPYLPIGFDDTIAVIEKTAAALKVGAEIVARLKKEASARFHYFLERFADVYFNFNFQVEFAVVGPTGQALGVSRFLTDTLGFVPKAVVITDNPPAKYREAVHAALPALLDASGLLFSEDLGEISSFIKKEQPELVLGSSLEAEAANEVGAAHLSISFPISDRVVVNKGYAGCQGGINLIEDIGTALIRHRRGERDYVDKVLARD